MKQYAVMAEFPTGSQFIGPSKLTPDSAWKTKDYVRKHNPGATKFCLVEREISDWRRSSAEVPENVVG